MLPALAMAVTLGAATEAGGSTGPGWKLELELNGFFGLDEGAQFAPTASVDRGPLHLEARYNYEDFHTATAQLAKTFEALAPELWGAAVDLGRGGPTSADVILAARLGEVEIHHHDLGVDDGLALLDDDQANRLLAALLRSYVRTREVRDLILEPDGRDRIVIGSGGPVVAGSALDIVGWLSGRGDGSALRTTGGLPELPSW